MGLNLQLSERVQAEPAGCSTESAAFAAELQMRNSHSMQLCHYRRRHGPDCPMPERAQCASYERPARTWPAFDRHAKSKKVSKCKTGIPPIRDAHYSSPIPCLLVPLVPRSLVPCFSFTASSTIRQRCNTAGSRPEDTRTGMEDNRTRRSSPLARRVRAGRGSDRQDTAPVPIVRLPAGPPGSQ